MLPQNKEALEARQGCELEYSVSLTLLQLPGSGVVLSVNVQ
jgi:hypothetical protein